MIVNMAIDCGKSTTKVVIDKNGVIQNFSFPTKVGKVTGIEEVSFTEASIVEINHKKLVCGADSIEYEMDTKNSKNNEAHQYCTALAIAKTTNNGDIVNVVIGCPLSEYANKQNRDIYLNNVLPKGRNDIEVDGEHRYFTIDKRMVLPEGVGIVTLNPELFEDDMIVVDLGGLNLNAIQVINGKIVPSSAYTDKLGFNYLSGDLMTSIKRVAQDAELSQMQITNVIKRGYVQNYRQQTEDVVREVVSNHINKVDSRLKNVYHNFNTLGLVFIGGTSIPLKPYILNKYPEAVIVDNPAFANASGFMVQLQTALNS